MNATLGGVATIRCIRLGTDELYLLSRTIKSLPPYMTFNDISQPSIFANLILKKYSNRDVNISSTIFSIIKGMYMLVLIIISSYLHQFSYLFLLMTCIYCLFMSNVVYKHVFRTFYYYSVNVHGKYFNYEQCERYAFTTSKEDDTNYDCGSRGSNMKLKSCMERNDK